MLPSSSSPVESAVVPVALPPCHQASRPPHDPSSGEATGGGSQGCRSRDVRPPDLCVSEGGASAWGAQGDVGPSDCYCEADQATRQDRRYVADLPGGGGGVEIRYVADLPGDGDIDTTPGTSNTTMGALPDLCDTSSGPHTRLHLDHGRISDFEEEVPQCQSPQVEQGHKYEDYDTSEHSSASRYTPDHNVVGRSRDTPCSSGSASAREVDIDETDSEAYESLSGEGSGVAAMVCGVDGGGVAAMVCGDGNGGGGAAAMVCDDDMGEEYHSAERTDTSEGFSVPRKDWPQVEDELCGPQEDYLFHDTQRISLIACGVTQCDSEPTPQVVGDVVDAGISDEMDTESSTPAAPGLSLITHNLHTSSHPMFHKWPCYFYITQDHLPTLSLDSHGRHIGSEPPLFFPPGGPGSQQHQHQQQQGSGPPLSEEEQVKMAKRMGLITHLPCGTFDETKKSGECVICMIDFSVGDEVRYLPCMHTYHSQCIDDWLMRSFTCPSCLEPVDAALLNTYGTS